VPSAELPVIQATGEMANRLYQVGFDAETIRMTGPRSELETFGLEVGAQVAIYPKDKEAIFHTRCIPNIDEEPRNAKLNFIALDGSVSSLLLVLTVHFSSQTGLSIDRCS
jgi:hypothetical protein